MIMGARSNTQVQCIICAVKYVYLLTERLIHSMYINIVYTHIGRIIFSIYNNLKGKKLMIRKTMAPSWNMCMNEIKNSRSRKVK